MYGVVHPAFSLEGESYDTPAVQQPGKTIQGKIVKVVKSDAGTHTWDVSVENEETGEVVPLHLDKATARKVTDIDPAVGEKVVVKYDDRSKHRHIVCGGCSDEELSRLKLIQPTASIPPIASIRGITFTNPPSLVLSTEHA